MCAFENADAFVLICEYDFRHMSKYHNYSTIIIVLFQCCDSEFDYFDNLQYLDIYIVNPIVNLALMINLV